MKIDTGYLDRTQSYSGPGYSQIVSNVSDRDVFLFKGKYYRVEEICFTKPLIVIEAGTLDDLMKNGMEDTDPFPYDLNKEEIVQEVRYALGIDPYPKE